jgi:isoamylase
MIRGRVKRAMLATVFLSAGTPMLLAGDEFGRSQAGNNNAYCQDNEISWLDWRVAASPPGIALTAYVARLIALRREHPVLQHPRFLHGSEYPAAGVADIAWFDQHGGTMPSEAWNDVEQRTLILRRAMRGREGTVTILTLLLNPTERAGQFRLPNPQVSSRILIDSAGSDHGKGEVRGQVTVDAHSAMLVYAELA